MKCATKAIDKRKSNISSFFHCFVLIKHEHYTNIQIYTKYYKKEPKYKDKNNT